MYSYLKKRPMLLSACLATVLSVLCFYYSGVSVIMGAAIIALFFVMILRRSRPSLIFSMLCVVLVVISIQFTLTDIKNKKSCAGNIWHGEFYAVENPVIKNDYNTVIAEVNQCGNLPYGTRVIIRYNGIKTICMGDMISGDTELISLRGSSYKASSYAEKIYLSAEISGLTVKSGASDKFLFYLSKLREKISGTLFENMSLKEAATANAIVTGDKSYITPEFLTAVRRAGISHVLVVSGMHMSIIMGFVLWLLERALYDKRIKALMMFCITVFLMALCGFTMSVMRAGITYMLMSLALLLGREGERANTLGAAVTVILVFSPFAVLSISFQLSVLSTFGVLVLSPPATAAICGRLKFKNGLLVSVVSLIISSLCATIMTMPVVVNCFGYISVVSILSNVFISSAVTVGLVFTFCGIIVSAVSYHLARPFFLVSGIMIKYINHITEVLGNFKYAVIEVDKIFIISAGLVIFIVIQMLLTCKERRYVLKLKELNEKIKAEGGEKLKCR